MSKVNKEWTLLGEFDFDAGDSGTVKLTNSANGTTIADAVKFELVEEAASTAATDNPETGDAGIVLFLVVAAASGVGMIASKIKK